jgi:acetyl-CoA carboxylase biotin carboxyl carrier protein
LNRLDGRDNFFVQITSFPGGTALVYLEMTMTEINPEKAAPPINWEEHVETLQQLAAVVSENGLSELELECDGVKFSLKGVTCAPVALSAAPVVMAAPGMPAAPSAPAQTESRDAVLSPMVGVFYRAPSPNDANFVEIGDRVEAGQTIGLIEAMKVFNEIIAESSGTVVEVLAETGQLVETGAKLLLLKRS